MNRSLSKLGRKYKNLSVPVRASIWFTICNIIQKGIQFLTIPIYTRLLSTDEYGVYSVFLSWLNIITIFATLNLSAGVFNNGMIKYETKRNDFMSAMQGLSTLITVALFAVYLVFASPINNMLGMSSFFVVAMFVQILFSPALLFWSARERFEFRYRKFVITTLILAVVTPVLSILFICIAPTHGAKAIVLGYVVAQAAVCLIFYVRNFWVSFKPYNKQYWNFALKFNIPLLPHYLSQIILNQSDRVMINNLCGSAQAGIYSVAYQLSTAMGLVTNGINSSFVPWTYNKLKEKKYEEIGKQTNILLALVAVLIVLVVAVAPEIILVVSTKEYYEAIWIIPPVACSVFFTFMYSLFANIEFYFEENKFIMIASVMSAAANIILNYIFITKYGYLAAGYTTVFCYGLYALGHYYFMRIVSKKHIEGVKIYNLKVIVFMTVLLFMISAVLMMLYNCRLIRFGIIIAVVGLAYLKRDKLVQRLTFLRK